MLILLTLIQRNRTSKQVAIGLFFASIVICGLRLANASEREEIEEHYLSGSLSRKGFIERGAAGRKVRVGRWREWHENKFLKMECTYVNGDLDGRFRSWSDEGILLEDSTWKRGTQDGVSKVYFPNGKLRAKKDWKENIPNGKFERYFESGEIAEQGRFEMGKKAGEWSEFYESGALKSKAVWSLGEISGSVSWWFESGVPQFQGRFENGAPVGRWVKFKKESGDILEVIDYNQQNWGTQDFPVPKVSGNSFGGLIVIEKVGLDQFRTLRISESGRVSYTHFDEYDQKVEGKFGGVARGFFWRRSVFQLYPSELEAVIDLCKKTHWLSIKRDPGDLWIGEEYCHIKACFFDQDIDIERGAGIPRELKDFVKKVQAIALESHSMEIIASMSVDNPDTKLDMNELRPAMEPRMSNTKTKEGQDKPEE